MLFGNGITRDKNTAGKILRKLRSMLCICDASKRERQSMVEDYHRKAAVKLQKEISIAYIVKSLRYLKNYVNCTLTKEQKVLLRMQESKNLIRPKKLLSEKLFQLNWTSRIEATALTDSSQESASYLGRQMDIMQRKKNEGYFSPNEMD